MKIPLLNVLLQKLRNLLASPVVMNILIVGTISFGVKIVGFYKETLIASTFGLSLVLDTFFIAILIPGFIQNVFVGAISNIFIPNYIREQGSSGNLGAFQSLVFLIVGGIMLFFSILTFLISDYFVETVFPNKEASFYGLIKDQLFVILPSLFFMGFSAILGSLIDIREKFLLSTAASALPALMMIIALLCFKEQLGNLALAYGFFIGSLLSFVALLSLAIKYQVLVLKRPRLNTNSKTMLRQLPAKITSGILTDVNPFVDQYFAAQLAIGSIAAIQYGLKLPSFISSLLILAVGTVILPYFSKVADESTLKAYHKLFQIIKPVFLGSMAVVLVLMFFSSDLVRLFYQRGEFTAEDSAIVTVLQQILFAYVPFTICRIIMGKFLTSINKNAFMAYTSLFNLGLNLVLNIVFVKKYGLYGLTLSTAFVAIISTFIFLIYIQLNYNKIKSVA